MTIKDLKENNLLLLECISGSKAYGLDTAKSDTDIKGVYYMPKDMFYGLEYIPQIANESNDEVYYELGRFVELLVKNNPNILELLATPKDCILYKHDLMEHLSIDIFLSKQCKDSFAGYAMTQIKKARGLNKKIVNPQPKERKSVLDFCFVLINNQSVLLKDWLAENNLKQEFCGLSFISHTKGLFALYYDFEQHFNYKGIIQSELANEVSLSSIPKGEKLYAYLYFNIESYSSYCKEYREYWDWVSNRNEERYKGNQAHGKDYDAKNMMHTIRLLQVAEEILRTNRLEPRRSNREALLAIKEGLLSYEDLIELANKIIQQIESAYLTCSLPDEVNKEIAERILVKIRKELYK